MQENGISEKLHQILGLSLEEKTTGNHSGFACLRCLSVTLTQRKLFAFCCLSLSRSRSFSVPRARSVSIAAKEPGPADFLRVISCATPKVN